MAHSLCMSDYKRIRLLRNSVAHITLCGTECSASALVFDVAVGLEGVVDRAATKTAAC